MRVDFPEHEKSHKPKHRILLRLVAEIVVDEYDIWSDFQTDPGAGPPSRITLGKVASTLKRNYANGTALLESLISNCADELKTTLDISFDEGSKVVELVEKSNGNT